MKVRVLKIISILGGLLLIFQLCYPFILRFIINSMTNNSLNFNSASSIGIIGGADSPTAVFISASDYILRNIITAFSIVLIIAPVVIIWRITKKK